jgi:hypothetical protein
LVQTVGAAAVIVVIAGGGWMVGANSRIMALVVGVTGPESEVEWAAGADGIECAVAGAGARDVVGTSAGGGGSVPVGCMKCGCFSMACFCGDRAG